GGESFTDEEIVELLLALGTPRKDTKAPARAALRHFGSLAAVLEAGSIELQKIPGIGPTNSFAIHFIHEVARRYLRKRLTGRHYLTSAAEVAEYLIHSMRDLEQEVLTAIFLDAGHAIIDSETVARGTVTASTVYPRELVKRALHHNAAALIIAHNHPSGRTSPSEADLQLTGKLHEACSLMHIRLLDHFIVGDDRTPFSFAENGIMDQVRRRYGGGQP
ncbi:MAG: DNA repair protein RadC, partial [Thermodesulfobacteriota bacterium]